MARPRRVRGAEDYPMSGKSGVYTPEQMRAANLWSRFGLTLKAYDDLLSSQEGVCAICKKPPPPTGPGKGRLCVDHDHETDTVRGLLCGHCNVLLGNAKDDISLLESAIQYLKGLK